MALKGGEFLIKVTDAKDIFIPEEWNEEQKMIAQTCLDFIETEINPILDEIDSQKDPELMPSLLDKAGQLGLLGTSVPEQYGGFGTDENTSFSEAVIVHFSPEDISLQTLIEIHLHTHKSTSAHSMRHKYRSAIYSFSDDQKTEAETILNTFQIEFKNKLITKVYPFSEFKASREAIQNYYLKNPEKPFCERFINPKLKHLRGTFSHLVNTEYISNNLTKKTT